MLTFTLLRKAAAGKPSNAESRASQEDPPSQGYGGQAILDSLGVVWRLDERPFEN
jgi:hypothetical protein